MFHTKKVYQSIEYLKIEQWSYFSGIIYKEITSEERFDIEIILSEVSKEEAFLICDNLFNIEKSTNLNLNRYNEEDFFKDNSHSLFLELGDGNSLSIIQTGFNTIITISHSG